MTTPERGLFERIKPYLESLHPNSAWRNRIIKAEIEKFQQRLAEAEAKAKIVDAMKAYDEADADAEFEPPHPIFRLAEERDAFMFECVQLRARCGELEKMLRLMAALATPQPAQELCTAHKRFPCRECGTTHFDGCQCGFCKQVEQEQIAK